MPALQIIRLRPAGAAAAEVSGAAGAAAGAVVCARTDSSMPVLDGSTGMLLGVWGVLSAQNRQPPICIVGSMANTLLWALPGEGLQQNLNACMLLCEERASSHWQTLRAPFTALDNLQQVPTCGCARHSLTLGSCLRYHRQHRPAAATVPARVQRLEPEHVLVELVQAVEQPVHLGLFARRSRPGIDLHARPQLLHLGQFPLGLAQWRFQSQSILVRVAEAAVQI